MNKQEKKYLIENNYPQHLIDLLTRYTDISERNRVMHSLSKMIREHKNYDNMTTLEAIELEAQLYYSIFNK